MKDMEHKFAPLTASERHQMEKHLICAEDIQLWCTAVFSAILDTHILIVVQ